MRLIRRLVLLAAVAGIGLLGYTSYRIWDAAARDERAPADAIVVMGAAQYDGRPSPVFAARLDHAIALYHDGLAPLLVMTGGKAEGDRTTEAAAARAYALARGVPAEAILAEDESRATLASVRAVAAVLAEAGAERAIFVSDPTHMYRVLRIAGDAGIQATGSPTSTSPVMEDGGAVLDAVLHEIGALLVYTIARDRP